MNDRNIVKKPKSGNSSPSRSRRRSVAESLDALAIQYRDDEVVPWRVQRMLRLPRRAYSSADWGNLVADARMDRRGIVGDHARPTTSGIVLRRLIWQLSTFLELDHEIDELLRDSECDSFAAAVQLAIAQEFGGAREDDFVERADHDWVIADILPPDLAA